MEKEKLILKYKEKEEELVYENRVILIEGKNLIKELGRTNIRNEDSSLIIKSMNDLPIYDVIQLKINVSETGTFLASFEKDKIDEKVREELINKIKELKNDVDPTLETQLEKIKKLISIFNEYKPIYVSYRNTGDIKINFDSLEFTKVKYPLFILQKPEKPKKEKAPKKDKPRKEIKFKKIKIKLPKLPSLPEVHIEFPLFTIDYLFVGIFSLLFSFGVVTGIFEILNKQSIAAFLLVLGGIFLGVGYYTIYSTLYKKGELKYKGLRYWLLIYIVVGAAIGIVVGYVISKFALKTEVDSLDFGKVMLLGAPISAVLSMLGIYASILINLVVKKLKK